MKMKKWGGKKDDPFSTSAASVLGGMFLVSWVSKFRKKGGDLEDSGKEKQRGKVDFPTPNSASWGEGRFYKMDEDDAYWRLSFTEERTEGRRSTGGSTNPLWRDSDDDDAQASVPSLKSLSLGEMEEENWNFNGMVLDMKKMNEDESKKGNQREDGKLCRRIGKGVKDQRLRKASSPLFDTVEMTPNTRKQPSVSLPNLDLSSIEEDSAYECGEVSEKVPTWEWRNLENKTMKKSSGYPNSRHANQEDVFSDMPKPRTKLRKKAKREQMVESITMFDSCAVVKSSFNPERDFRESMIEMMIEHDVRQPEELEELLACYLTFNRDEYHGMIIQVFRQAWFQLKPEWREAVHD